VRVVLTGSAGFIGSAIAGRLEARGDEVVLVDAMNETAHRGAPAPEGTHVLDVRDAASWTRLLEGADAVCHQAAVVGVETFAADLARYAGHNDLGTTALLAAMATVRCHRLVLASSMVVYGEGHYRCERHGPCPPTGRSAADLVAGRFDHLCPECGGELVVEPVGEVAPLVPRSGYAASKVAQEHYAAAWSRLVGGSVIALRYHNVYGPGMPRDTPYSGVAAMFRSAIERGDRPRVFEDGRQQRDFVHVDDVARANLAAIDALADAVPFAAFNVASGRPIGIADVAELVAAGRVAPEVTGEYRVGDIRHIVASPERARRQLGFTATVTPEVGLPGLAHAPLRG
jgi:dTDP-L-rhamnose 4-epimerase